MLTLKNDMPGLMIEFKSKDIKSSPKGSPKGSGKSSGKSSGKGSGKTVVQIIRLIGANPNITIPELAEALGITTRAIEKQISSLRKTGQLKRIGPARGGHWEVIIKEK